MNREQASFLLGGVLFGLVAGLVLGMIFFKPGVLGSPETVPTGAAGPGGGAVVEPSTGGMDPGGMASMEQVTRELDTLKAAVADNPADFDALMRLGDLYLEVSMYDRARAYYEQASAADPHSPLALSAAGLCWYRKAEPARAIELYTEALKHDDSFWPAHAYAVMAAMEVGDESLARQSLAALKRLNPSFEHMDQFESGVSGMGAGDMVDPAEPPPAPAGS